MTSVEVSCQCGRRKAVASLPSLPPLSPRARPPCVRWLRLAGAAVSVARPRSSGSSSNHPSQPPAPAAYRLRMAQTPRRAYIGPLSRPRPLRLSPTSSLRHRPPPPATTSRTCARAPSLGIAPKAALQMATPRASHSRNSLLSPLSCFTPTNRLVRSTLPVVPGASPPGLTHARANGDT